MNFLVVNGGFEFEEGSLLRLGKHTVNTKVVTMLEQVLPRSRGAYLDKGIEIIMSMGTLTN